MSTTPTERRPTSVGWLVGAVGALAVAWLTTTHPLPVYDGINAPDEPYRYASAPAGSKTTPPPTRATAESPATGGLNTAELRAKSAEVGPQVQVVVPALSVAGPPAQHVITLVVEPLAPDVAPALGPIDGNVYRLSLAAGPEPASFRTTQAPGAIRLRATTDSQPGPVVVHRAAPGQPWSELSTTRVGNDIYEADLVGVGDYALAFATKDAPRPPTAGGGGPSPAVYVVIGLLVVSVVAGSVLATRRREPR